MAKGPKKQIFILDCCGIRFSRVVFSWISEADIDQEINVELFTDQYWKVIVHNILPAFSSTHRYVFDVVFLRSNDEALFEELCNSLGKEGGWSEDEKACLNVPRIGLGVAVFPWIKNQ